MGNVDVLVAGIGTGGTVTGTRRYLKTMNKKIKVVGVEPADRSVISGDNPSFMPNILDIKLLDEVIKVNKKIYLEETNRLVREIIQSINFQPSQTFPVTDGAEEEKDEDKKFL